MNSSSRVGLIRVFTGNGKGKTTAAFGYAVRAVGHGMKVCIVQFMKHGLYGEVIAAKRLEPNLVVVQFGSGEFIDRMHVSSEDIEEARKALEYAAKIISESKYDIVVLDEVNVAISWGLIGLDDVIRVLKEKPRHVEVVLTGRYAPKELIDIADTVVEYVEIKHPSKRGVKARPGIEY